MYYRPVAVMLVLGLGACAHVENKAPKSGTYQLVDRTEKDVKIERDEVKSIRINCPLPKRAIAGGIGVTGAVSVNGIWLETVASQSYAYIEFHRRITFDDIERMIKGGSAGHVVRDITGWAVCVE